MALRVDIGALKPAKKLADGRVRAEAHITRAGVFEYMDDRGRTWKELRDDSEVFDPESMESFAQVPVTSTHPGEKVTADNARMYMVGASDSRIVRDDDHLRAGIMIADSETLEDMRANKRFEVSCGYTCDVVEEGGVHPRYGAYDKKQTNIRGNHIAVNIDRARAGSSARVRMDAVDPFDALSMRVAESKARAVRLDGAAHMVQDDVDPAPKVAPNPSNRGRQMPPLKKPEIKTDDTKKLLDAAADELAKAEQRADAAEESLAAEKKRADGAEGRVESLEAEIVGLKANALDGKEITKRDATIAELTKKLGKETSRADTAESPERFNNGVRRRVKIIAASEAVLGEKMVTDSATDRELMIAVVEKLHNTNIEKDDAGKERSLDYITARFDAAMESFLASGDALERLREMTRGRTNEEPREDASTARNKYVEKQQNAWKKKSA